ncbi:MAG: DUF4082 domain-containing protein [Elusimicrobiota bacterium]
MNEKIPLKIIISILFAVLFIFFTGNQAKAEGVFDSCEAGSLAGPIFFNYSMGYKFTLSEDGQITKLCGFFSGTRTVNLYSSAYVVLASASVTANGTNWVCSDITPVNVSSGQSYFVIVYSGSGAYYRTGETLGATKVCQGVTINYSAWQQFSGTFNSSHNSSIVTMYGMADIVFIPGQTVGMVGNVSGFAWSENIGWISFNSSNCDIDGDGLYDGSPLGCPASGSVNPYSVDIDSDGYFYGYAWSENIGWISFNRTDTGNPPEAPYNGGSGPIATFDSVSEKVSGWARALVNGGGWDGWIKLGDDSGVWPAGGQQVSIVASDEFMGWAWGDDVVGWLSFNCLNQGVCGASDYKVIVSFTLPNPPPYVENTQTVSQNYCGIPGDMGQVSFEWTYRSEDESQTQYNLQVTDFADTDFSNPSIDCTKNQSVPPDGLGSSGVVVVTPAPVVDCDAPNGFQVAYGQSYLWRVRVYDGVAWSDFEPAGGVSFTTENHPYPRVDFDISTENPSAREEVNATSTSEVFVAGEPGYKWEINPSDHGTFKTSDIIPSPKMEFTESATLKLTVTDSSGYFCDDNKIITVELSLPDWTEVPPISFLNKLLVAIFNFLKF